MLMRIFFLLIFYGFSTVFAADESEEDVEIDEYYGVPLGAIHFSNAGLSAEVYAADEYTVVLNHLMHHPKQSGCNAIIVGPPRPQDKTNLIQGHGVYMSISSNAKLRLLRRRFRTKRNSYHRYPGGLMGVISWPVEFGHMVHSLESEKNVANGKEGRPSSFEGIELKHSNETDVKKIDLEELDRLEEEVNQATTKKAKKVEKLKDEKKKMDKPEKSTMATTIEKNNTTSTTTAKSITSNKNGEKSTKKLLETTVSITEPNQTTKTTTKSQPLTKPARTTTTPKSTTKIMKKSTKPLKIFEKTSPTPLSRRLTTTAFVENDDSFNDNAGEDYSDESMKNTRKKSTTKGPGLIVSFPEAKRKKEKVNVQLHPVDEINYKEIRKLPRRVKKLDEVPRRAPMHKTPTEVQFAKNGDRWVSFESLKNNDFDIPTLTSVTPPLPTTLATPETTTPLFYVIDDPREARRLARLQRLKEAGFVMQPITRTTPAKTTTVKSTTPAFLDDFALPEVTDRIAAFALTNGAKLKDYQWFGVYDSCSQNHVPLIYFKDIDPPKEEKIMPLSGWSHNVSSYRVQILNCNTILIPGFSYEQENSTENTYFYVGVGKFPDYIEKQLRATIVGQKENDPIRSSYEKEDVLLRLPKTYRTFDIDFISVYNDDEQKSYGHVIVPSLLVPPCNDD